MCLLHLTQSLRCREVRGAAVKGALTRWDCQWRGSFVCQSLWHQSIIRVQSTPDKLSGASLLWKCTPNWRMQIYRDLFQCNALLFTCQMSSLCTKLQNEKSLGSLTMPSLLLSNGTPDTADHLHKIIKWSSCPFRCSALIHLLRESLSCKSFISLKYQWSICPKFEML